MIPGGVGGGLGGAGSAALFAANPALGVASGVLSAGLQAAQGGPSTATALGGTIDTGAINVGGFNTPEFPYAALGSTASRTNPNELLSTRVSLPAPTTTGGILGWLVIGGAVFGVVYLFRRRRR